jgi:hypothetical protein
MYGYLDESGVAGAARVDNDYFVVSLVLFPDKEAVDKCSAAIDRLRDRLGKDSTYEFHRSGNSSATKSGFAKLLPNLDFKFITIAIRKNNFKKHASYTRVAELLVREIADRFTEIKIEMDSNPLLYSEIRKQLKAKKLRYIRVKQVKSHTNNLIQLADYVVNISAKKAKRTPKSLELYRPIAGKAIYFGEVIE